MLTTTATSVDDGLFHLIQRQDGPLNRLERIDVPRGTVLIEQGSAPDAMYLIETGRFQVARSDVKLAEIGPGEIAGEIAFFTGGERTASVIAARDSVVLKLTEADYAAACDADPGFARAVSRILADRLARTSLQVETRPAPPLARTVALLPVGDQRLPEGLADQMSRAFGQITDHRLVTREMAEKAGKLGNETDLVTWMHGQERLGGHVVYVPEADDEAWTRLVLRQADQVLLVTRAGTPPPLSETERFAFDIFPGDHRRLLIVHPKRSHWVTGTAAWLDSRPVFMHHHLAEGADEDVARVARFLAGKAIGFVASGGGAFGALHTGVYGALVDRGVDFDIFGGTSVGSAMTAAIAMGLTHDEIDRRTGDIFVTNAAMERLSFPKYGLLDHTVFDAQLRKHFTDQPIEDMWYPYFAVATDLSENTTDIIRRGPLWRAVRASCAIPGVLPPLYTEDGRMLVDGGTMDNMPYREMHSVKTGPNVIVSFLKPVNQRFDVDYDSLPGRWPLIWRMIWPFAKKPPRAPGIVPVVMRSLLAKQASETPALTDSDWHIVADTPKGAGFLDWKKHRALYERGAEIVKTLMTEDFGPEDPRTAFKGRA